MQLEPQVTFKNVDPSDLILGRIHRHLSALAQTFPGLVACRVVFERPWRPHRKVELFRVDLVLSLPDGIDIAINRDPPEFGREDPGVAIDEAFEIAERRLGQSKGRRQAHRAAL